MSAHPREVVERFIEAYNDYDIDTLEQLMDEEIELQHHNRGFQTSGRADTVTLYRGTPDVIPQRALVDRTAVLVDGESVVVQHRFVGTPKVDVPFGPAGVEFSIDLVTVFRVRAGRVVSYEDYG